VIRLEKVEMDREINLLTAQITDLQRHIERYEGDVERLTQDKNELVERLNDLSGTVSQRI
jgi:ribosomal protein S15P/S13E